MGSTRIKGTALMLKVGAPGTDFWADCTSVVLDNEERDAGTVTFEDAAAGGGRQWFFTIGAIQSMLSTSFWRYCWEHSGEDVAFVYAPHGNASPSAAQPHFTGTVTIGPKPTVGGEAGRDNDYTYETRWDLVGEPVLDDGTP